MPSADTGRSIRMQTDIGRTASFSAAEQALAEEVVSGHREYSENPRDVAGRLDKDSGQLDNESGRLDKESVLADAIASAGGGGLRKVCLQVHDGVLVLTGTVSSFYLKQLAQETVRPLAIGMRIENQIAVD